MRQLFEFVGLLDSVPFGEFFQPVRQPAIGLDAINRQPACGGFPAQSQFHCFEQGHLAFELMFLPEFDRGFDLFRVERDPLSANLHQRRLQLCQRPELGFGQLSFAQRQLPLIIDQALHRHSAFGKGILALLRFHLHFDAQPRTLFVPPRWDENPEARAFEQRRSLA